MQTDIARRLLKHFPMLAITEDVVSDENYWVNVLVDERWLVIQKTASQGIGLSIVEDESMDFGGHDHVVSEIDEAIDWSVLRINELSPK